MYDKDKSHSKKTWWDCAKDIGQATTAERLVRGWRRINCMVLHRILEDSPLCRAIPEDADINDLFATYDDVLHGAADRLAPKHPIRRPVPRSVVQCRLSPCASSLPPSGATVSTREQHRRSPSLD